jgi:DNA-binding response OmpR family regulator
VLLADHRPEVRSQWRAALEGDGLRVLEADSRTAALALIEAGGIDLLVTSLLGDGSGAELAVQAYALAPSLPMVLAAEMADRVGLLNGIAVLLEPVAPEELTRMVGILLAR